MIDRPLCLFVFANAPPDDPNHLRRLAAERNRLRDPLDRIREKLGVDVIVEVDPTPSALLSVLHDPRNRDRIVLVHYAGHAAPDRWLLSGSIGEGELHADGFVGVLDSLPGLRLVVLNGCSTAAQAGALASSSRLVIGTEGPIADDVAELFAVRLYHGLSRGATVAEAFQAARDDVLALRSQAQGRLWRMARPRGAPATRFPWHLAPSGTGDETPGIHAWRLSDAVTDPLAGLPPLPAGSLPDNPYRHVERFTGDHAEVFFGRSAEIRQIYDALLDPHAAPILVLCGVAGVGKSSLLEAGVVPRLRERGRKVAVHRHDPTTRLVDGLGTGLGLDREDDIDWHAAERAAEQPLVAVVDQLEEALIAAHGRVDALDALLAPVGRAFSDPIPPAGRLVLSLRKSHLAEVRAALKRNGLRCTTLFIEPLDEAAVIEIVRGPLSSARLRERYRLEIEDGLAERIAHDLTAGNPGAVAPVLQILLTDMWGSPEAYPVVFDIDRYARSRLRGVALEQVFQRQLGAAEGETTSDGLVLDILAFHTTARGTSHGRHDDAVARTYGRRPFAAAVDACMRHRLLLRWTAESDAGSIGGTRLAHDVWGPLVLDGFRRSERPGQRARRILENRVTDWHGASNLESAPLDAYDLARVEAGLSGMRALTVHEMQMLAASRASVARSHTRRRRRRYLAIAAIAGILITATVAVLLSLSLRTSLRDLTDANRAVLHTLDALRASRWRAMAASTASDSTLQAAALAAVPDKQRDVIWFQDTLVALSRPSASDWVPADRMLGFAPDGRLAVIEDATLVLYDVLLGGVERRPLPPGWEKAPLTFDQAGRLIALLHTGSTLDETSGRQLYRLDGSATARPLGAAFPCSGGHVLRGDGRWLFGGICSDTPARPWLIDGDGHRVEFAAPPAWRALGQAGGADVRVHAIDPRNERMTLCVEVTRATGEGDSRRAMKVVEIAGRTDGVTHRRVIVKSAESCPPIAFSPDTNTLLMLAQGKLMITKPPVSIPAWSDDSTKTSSWQLKEHISPRLATGVYSPQWSLAVVDLVHGVAAAEDGSVVLTTSEPNSPLRGLQYVIRLDSALSFGPDPWFRWFEFASPGHRFDPRVAVHPFRMFVADYFLGTVRLWSPLASTATEAAAVDIDGATLRLPPRRRPSATVTHVPQAFEPVPREALGLYEFESPVVSPDGHHEVVWRDGAVRLNSKRPGQPEWSSRLPWRHQRGVPLSLRETFRFTDDSQWLVSVNGDGGRTDVWPTTIAAAGDMLDHGRRGCIPAKYIALYHGRPLDEAEAMWATCDKRARAHAGR